ncbi:MAG: thioredoxin [Desulfosudaceae bacterium]
MTIETITDKKRFDQVTGSGTCLVDFNAVWCGPCKAQEPVLEKLAADFDGRVTFAAVDVDRNPDAAALMKVMSIPTLVLFREGKEMNRFVGLQSENVLSEAIEQML